MQYRQNAILLLSTLAKRSRSRDSQFLERFFIQNDFSKRKISLKEFRFPSSKKILHE
jgi:hypothetical protein